MPSMKQLQNALEEYKGTLEGETRPKASESVPKLVAYTTSKAADDPLNKMAEKYAAKKGGGGCQII